MKQRGIVVAILMFAALAASVAPAQAQDYRFFEAYAGYYDPAVDGLDNDITVGARYGRRFNPNFGWELTAGLFDVNGEENRPLEGVVGDASAFFGEVSAVWFVGGSNFALLAGAGFATVDIDLVGTTQDASDDTFTWHVGTFYQLDLGESFYLKPEVRVRTFDGDFYDKTDVEYTLGFGWRF